MEKQESLQSKLVKILGTIEKGSRKISEAIQKEDVRDSYDLNSVKNGLLDFDLLETDVKELYKTLETKGKKVLGTHLILVDDEDKMELQIYTQKDDKTNRITITRQVERVTNIRDDLFDELKKKGKVEISLKI